MKHVMPTFAYTSYGRRGKNVNFVFHFELQTKGKKEIYFQFWI